MSIIIRFEEFLRLPSFFSRNIGIILWGQRGKLFDRFMFYFSSINLFLTLLAELWYIISTISTDFITAIMGLSYVSFVVLAEVKFYYLIKYDMKVSTVLKRLNALFPHTKEEQENIQLIKYLKMSKFYTLFYTVTFMLVIWTYNLYTVSQRFIYTKILQVREIERELPYPAIYFWNWQDNWSYFMLYISQSLAGWHATCAQILTDLLICILISHLIMHYDHIARSLLNYQSKFAELYGKESTMKCMPKLARVMMEERAVRADMKFLADIIAYHTELLSLTESLNDVFGVPLFMKFMSSSAIICFLGFQMTVNRGFDLLTKLALFFILSVLQVYLICHFGQLLIDASTNVSTALYSQDWTNADVRYQKMLVLIIKRAQRSATLKATNFIIISRATMTEIMQMSYKFFALIRTMYND